MIVNTPLVLLSCSPSKFTSYKWTEINTKFLLLQPEAQDIKKMATVIMHASSSLLYINNSYSSPILPVLPKLHLSKTPSPHLRFSKFQQNGLLVDSVSARNRGFSLLCSYKSGDDSQSKVGGLDWPILKRWDVPWKWQTVSLTSLACGLSFILAGLIEAAALPYFGLQIGELSLDQKAEILFVDQGIVTAAVLAVMYSLTNYQPLPDDFFRYDWREPFNLQKGWLLWAGIGLAGALASIALTGAVMSLVRGENPQRETDALVLLLPLIGSSFTSTACLVGITGVFAPLLEETIFRGFFMVSLTKWLPTPLSVLVSAAVFAAAHLTPGEFPQLFVLGTALGFSYAHTRNLLTPITIHAIWNSGIILFLTFLQLQGYDLKELLQSS